MTVKKVIIENTQTGENDIVTIGRSTKVTFTAGDRLILGTEEFPNTIDISEIIAIRKGDDLELVIGKDGQSLLIIEDYFLYATGSDISYLSDVNQATELSLSDGSSLLNIPDQTMMNLSDMGNNYPVDIAQYGSLEPSFKFLDTTTLLTAGAVLTGIGVYAFTSSSSDDNGNASAPEEIVFPPKDLKATDISLAHVDKDDKLVSNAGKAGQINTLTPEIQGLKSSATVTNEIVIELPNGKTYTTKVESDGSWYFKIPEGQLKAGDKGNIKVYEKNNKDQKSKVVEVPFEIDVEKPKTFEKPYLDGAAEDGTVNSNTPTIKGEKAEAGTQVKIVSPTGSTHYVDVDKDGKWSFTFPDLKMNEGQKKDITVTIVDAAGNTGESFTIPIIKDMTPPVAPKLDTIAAKDNVGPVKSDLKDKDWTDDAKPTFSGTGEAGMSLLVYVDGRKLTLKTPVKVGTNGQWSYEFEDALQDGYRKIEFRLQDSAGNISQSSPAYYLNIDTATLTKTVLSEFYVKSGSNMIENGGEVITNQSMLTGKAEANIEKVMIYQYDINGAKGTLIGEAVVSYGRWSYNLDKEDLLVGKNNIKLVPIAKNGVEMTLNDAPNITFDFKPTVAVLGAMQEAHEFESMFFPSGFETIDEEHTQAILSVAGLETDMLLLNSEEDIVIDSLFISTAENTVSAEASESSNTNQTTSVFDQSVVNELISEIETYQTLQ